MLAYFRYSGLIVRTVEQALVAVGLEGAADASGWLEAARRSSTTSSTRAGPASGASGGASSLSADGYLPK